MVILSNRLFNLLPMLYLFINLIADLSKFFNFHCKMSSMFLHALCLITDVSIIIFAEITAADVCGIGFVMDVI